MEKKIPLRFVSRVTRDLVDFLSIESIYYVFHISKLNIAYLINSVHMFHSIQNI